MFKTDTHEPLSHRDIARLKRNHWQPLGIGGARLHWVFEDGHWLMTAQHGTVSQHLPTDTDRNALNAAWSAWVSANA